MILNELKNKITLGDSLDILKQLPDKCIDLILTDPPYGISYASHPHSHSKVNKKDWDDSTPSDEFFLEILRVSKNQIIFGGNYFPILWKFGGKGFIFWNKNQPVKNFADGELVWTSFDRPAKKYDFTYYGNLEGNTVASEKIHPTQKPLKLFEAILRDYAPRVARGGG